ncbi:MAG: hypothetical protein JO043_12925 [Candidatus Eremiobacteraeota bacterium]|nr:hypothetical protein [Candidatus Eremiobacteraeota bacterium]
MYRFFGVVLSVVAGSFCLSSSITPAFAATIDSSLLSALHWRMIGPFRGGRTVAVTGIPGDPRTFYSGAVGGGVWKSENAGRTWNPIFDGEPVASIGAIAVAPSDPATIYVGSGEADMRSDIIAGNGMYVSHDAGASWSRIGLDDSRHIGRILVDPRNARTLLVSVLGHAYGPNDMRGIYRSVDGGTTWTRMLFVNRDTGAIDLAADPTMHTVYASLWQTRRPPWSVYPPSNGPGSGLYVSRDGGVTWGHIFGGGFPSEGLGKIGLAVAPSAPRRIYAIVDAKKGGLYRSDDGGSTWRLMDEDRRLWQRGWYFSHVTVDPKNADIVYISNTSFYRSVDGGLHFTAIKGSPDGDDFHQLWIDPKEPSRMVLASDQGTSVSIDGAQTWSSWFNQPTAQFYHVATDNAFPYHLYGAQQDSGAAMVSSRSDHRGIQERDWKPIVAGGESDSVAPTNVDSLQSGSIFGGFVDHEDLRSSQTRSLSPTAGRPGEWRAEWTTPIAFGPDSALYSSRQIVFRSRDGGQRWQRISGDLTRAHPGAPANLDAPAAADFTGAEPRGVVYAIAPSPLRANVVWAGTDDGLVYLTRDSGRSWHNVTPPGVTTWAHVDTIEASRFDANVAYVAVDRHRLDDERPYIYATRDGGRTWRSAIAGIPDGSFVWVVREDAARRGLLYAGTETGVFASFDDGASWQSLRLNMPVVPVHDISVHGADLAIATHGRAFWVLDDVAPLRELALNGSRGLRLFSPVDAIRTRPPNDEAEASPPETPQGENPPYGAPIDYLLPAGFSGTVSLSILDERGRMVRRWSSTDSVTADNPDEVDYPAYWIAQPARLAASPGMHRFYWDFRMSRADGVFAPPGRYTARLSAGATTLTRGFIVRRDPRIHASDRDLTAQVSLASAIDVLYQRTQAAIRAATEFRKRPNVNIGLVDAIAGPPPNVDLRNSVAPRGTRLSTLREEERLLTELEDAVESADTAPTPYERETWRFLSARTRQTLSLWDRFVSAHR